jgi:hypothetical protein
MRLLIEMWRRECVFLDPSHSLSVITYTLAPPHLNQQTHKCSFVVLLYSAYRTDRPMVCEWYCVSVRVKLFFSAREYSHLSTLAYYFLCGQNENARTCFDAFPFEIAHLYMDNVTDYTIFYSKIIYRQDELLTLIHSCTKECDKFSTGISILSARLQCSFSNF